MNNVLIALGNFIHGKHLAECTELEMCVAARVGSLYVTTAGQKVFFMNE